MEWYEMKLWVETSLGLDKDALHIYGALTVQLLTAFVLRRSLASPWPLLAAAGIALLNEYLDFQGAGPSPRSIELYKAAAFHDLWNTMLLPAGLFFLARFWPSLLTARRSVKPVVPGNSDMAGDDGA